MFFNFILAIFGNIIMVVLFAKALIWPADNLDFITGSGLLLFVVEFFSLHASGMFSGLEQSKPQDLQKFKKVTISVFGGEFIFYAFEIFMIAFYFLFMVGYGWHFRNWVLPGMFVMSVLSKFFGRRVSTSTEEQNKYALFVLAFLLSTFLMVFLQGALTRIFSFPESLIKSGGLFQRVPQAILGWGAMYYSLCVFIEWRSFLKAIKKPAVTG